MTEFIWAHLGTIIAIVSGLGSLGIGAVILIAGVPAAAVIASALSLGGKLVEFLKTPVGQAIGVAGLCGLCLFIGDARGHRQEIKVTAEKVAARDVYWKAQIKQASDDFGKARKNRDKSVADEIDNVVNKRLLEIKAQEQAITDMGLKHENPTSDADKGCILTPADVADGVRGKPSKRTANGTAGRGPARK